MIKSIIRSELRECLDVLKAGYEDIAIKFGMTEDNCPYRGRTRLPFVEFEKEFLTGYQMYGYFFQEKLVGFLSLVFKENRMDIHDLAILPEYQNNGFGSDLMRFAKEKAAERKCERIMLGMIDDNKRLKDWYEKHGFITIDQKRFDTVTYTVGKMECVTEVRICQLSSP